MHGPGFRAVTKKPPGTDATPLSAEWDWKLTMQGRDLRDIGESGWEAQWRLGGIKHRVGERGTMTELCFESAVDLARRIRRGDLSPVTVVDAVLDRIDALDDEVNAYVTVREEAARAAAKEAEQAVANGEAVGPLHGVPIAVKDLENVEGERVTFGSKPLADTVAEDSEPFVHRLREAGAIIIGKTNTPEFGHKGTTDNLVTGPTSTPYAIGRNAGGSSGGSAAAVAAGMAPIAQGSDGGGSIRIPSAWCGVFGIKPTYRRIERRSRPDGFSHTPFSQLGPHARTVEDAALLLDVMAGPGPTDPLVAPDDGSNFVEATRRSIDDFDVAYSPDLDVFPIDDGVRTVVDDAVDAFASAGASVDEIEIGIDLSRQELCETWLPGFEVHFADLAAHLEETEGVDYTGAHRDQTTEDFAELIEQGRAYSAVEYKGYDSQRTALFESIQSVLAEYDVLVAPTLAVPPVENADDGTTVGPTEVNGEAVNPLIGWCLTYPFNLTGHPVASVPAGLDTDGLPVGLQVVGRRWADEDVFAASAALERVRPWHDTYPR